MLASFVSFSLVSLRSLSVAFPVVDFGRTQKAASHKFGVYPNFHIFCKKRKTAELGSRKTLKGLGRLRMPKIVNAESGRSLF